MAPKNAKTEGSNPLDFLSLNDATPLEAALQYAAHGYPVIMLEEMGKAPHPTVRVKWTSKGTCNPATIRRWWTQNPKANVGLTFTKDSFHEVLDLDCKPGKTNGVEKFSGYHERIGGPTARTPSGGLHRLFKRSSDPRLQRNFSPRGGGFDFMRRSRQIAVAPSRVKDEQGNVKRYEWVKSGPLGEISECLADKIVAEADEARRDKDFADAPTTPAICGHPIPHTEAIKKLDRSQGIYDLARYLYMNHGDRSDSDILATVWAEPIYQQAALERREGNEASALNWLWKYSVFPASGWKVPIHEVDDGDYDPRPSAMAAQIDGRELAPWEHAADKPSVLLDIPRLLEAEQEYQSPPEFVIPKWFPKSVVTTLFGKDGIGKTLFMMRTCTALATGKPILGRDEGAPPVKCLMLLAEDTPNAIVARNRSIRRELQLGPEYHDLINRNLIIPLKLMNMDVKMMSFNRDMEGKHLPFFAALEDYIDAHRPEMVVLDPISDLYADEENNRAKVSQFMRALNAIALRHDIALVLLGHPAKADDSEYSGSGAWSSKSRSRLLIKQTKGDTVTLIHRKASYGIRADDLVLAWTEHGTLVDMTEEQAEQHTHERTERLRKVLCDGLVALARLHLTAPLNMGGANNFSSRFTDNGLCGDFTPAELFRQVEPMVEEGILEAGFVFDGRRGTPVLSRSQSRRKAGIWFTDEAWRQRKTSVTDAPDW